MAILRKNRINSPPNSPEPADTPNNLSRGPRTPWRSLLSLSPTFATTSNLGFSSSSSNHFNPKLILAQIIAIQSLHYLVLSFLFQINYVLYGTSITIDRIFTVKYVKMWHADGFIDICSFLISSVVGSLLLAVIVEKSKKCLDFAITLFSVHLFLCTIYDGFPKSLDWWIIQVLGTIIMVLLGEYFCSKIELREIPLLWSSVVMLQKKRWSFFSTRQTANIIMIESLGRLCTK